MVPSPPLMVEAADLGRHRGMFADWTVRHPDNENGELLQHCGPWPVSVAKESRPSVILPLTIPELWRLRQNTGI